MKGLKKIESEKECADQLEKQEGKMQNWKKHHKATTDAFKILNRLNSMDLKKGVYFDYDGVIEILEQVQKNLDDSIRYPRPAGLPKECVWDEKPWNEEDEYDQYSYSNTLSGGIYDFENEKAGEENGTDM